MSLGTSQRGDIIRYDCQNVLDDVAERLAICGILILISYPDIPAILQVKRITLLCAFEKVLQVPTGHIREREEREKERERKRCFFRKDGGPARANVT